MTRLVPGECRNAPSLHGITLATNALAGANRFVVLRSFLQLLQLWFNGLGCIQWPVLSENGDLHSRIWCSVILSQICNRSLEIVIKPISLMSNIEVPWHWKVVDLCLPLPSEMQIAENLDVHTIELQVRPNDGTGIIPISSPPEYCSNQIYICLVYFSPIMSAGRNPIWGALSAFVSAFRVQNPAERKILTWVLSGIPLLL
jgi:hypothetical protein